MSMFLVPANIYDEGSTNRQQPQHHQEQQQPQPSLAPNIDRLSTGLTRDTSDVAASAPVDEVYLSHSHQSLRATPSLPTYEDSVTHQGYSAVSEPQMTLPTYEEAEALWRSEKQCLEDTMKLTWHCLLVVTRIVALLPILIHLVIEQNAIFKNKSCKSYVIYLQI